MNCITMVPDNRIIYDKDHHSTDRRTSNGLSSCLRGESEEHHDREDEYKSNTLPRIHFNDTATSSPADTSYEKACRRGSSASITTLGQKHPQESQTTSRLANFFSKRSFRSNPLKRTKSVTKLERSKRGSVGLRGSRSHESLLSNHAVMSAVDLSCVGVNGVAPVHQSVLGRRYCFQVRGGPCGERYYSCNSRQERDLWIYSLRKSIAPNAEHTRRTDNSLKIWIQEAKAISPKKRYFCEIHLDQTLYGRTSVKQKTDLLFWGEYFDFPDIPDISMITVNVFREGDKKKKREKHILIGTVKIPVHDVSTKATREFAEDWYPIVSEKRDSIGRNASKEPIPTLRIKCRFQSIDILPVSVYTDFLQYLKGNYKKVCELLEPVILVKPKEDIGQALVLLMHAHGMAGPFLTDVVALDLLRVDDQRLTFRGNSLATKSMEAFLKLTGEQYLQDTLSNAISDIILSEKDFEVDPLKAHGSLSRQQQALRNAVRSTWNSIADSHRSFPPLLRECFATFRERLIDLGREDMADNLISASIFLRFLCPAILSPSLFNIKNELPTPRATRNLTLVAKTLQTLANFTRFQGKEDFMEFLNDFLEAEAPRMNEFLRQISTRTPHAQTDSVIDWHGYIDEGKQLAILHYLLVENIKKLPPSGQSELDDLQNILQAITTEKMSNCAGASNTHTTFVDQNREPNNSSSANQQSTNDADAVRIVTTLENGKRGIIRGVLTPSSLEKNIFRYNDPTVSLLLKHSDEPIYPIQHSHSISSISTISNQNYQHHHSMPITSVHHHHHNHTPSAERFHYMQQQQQQQQQQQSYSGNVYLNVGTVPSTSRTLNPSSTSTGHKKESVRASTLPRNNQTMMSDSDDTSAKNLVQIGVDTSTAFVRKSPLFKPGDVYTHSISHSQHKLNDSQLSLLNERSGSSKSGKSELKLNLGIPHSHSYHSVVSACVPNHNSNMPMKLEDLDDLLKYADEHVGDETSPSRGASTLNRNVNSGYCYVAQVPNCTNHNTEDDGNNSNNNSNNSLGITNPPLAFKNPLYQLQSPANMSGNNANGRRMNPLLNARASPKLSSMTPSSSDERLSNSTTNEKYDAIDVNENYNSKNLNENMQTTSGATRLQQTSPLMETAKNGKYSNSASREHHHRQHRYQRRLSLESSRTLSDSSSDGGEETNRERLRGSQSVEQCEREIQRLQSSLDTLRSRIGDESSDICSHDSNNDMSEVPRQSDVKMRNIITKLLSMEEELRREQLKMSLALSHKQRVIEAQGQQIAALDAANNRLLSALSSLRQRYESNGQHTQHTNNNNNNNTSN